ncbi:MAG: sensor histidine kinase, partial [Ktedonobacterales bacterium]
YFITVVEDITASKMLEQQRSDILNIVAHDLSNPLTTMKTRLQLIRRQMAAGKTPEASVLKTAASALTRMERLVGDLRDAASADTHQLALKIAPYDIVALCRAEAEAQMQTNKGRHIDLILPAEPVIAEVDSDRITRLLGNLLSNAIKYSPPDEPITLSLERQIESSPNGMGRLVAHIAVCDHGIGIAHDVLPHIFERFYRAPGIQEEQVTHPSLGLGLYICRMLVEEHGGFIGTESTLGQGSTFFVTLPLAYPKESRS